jgi:AraC-like DNA-binding protein
MRSGSLAGAMTPLWDIATPSRPSRVPGVSMAGFRDRSAAPFDLRPVPHYAVMLIIDLGTGRLVVDHAAGRERDGCLVAGLAFGTIRARGEGIETLQVRLSPVVARAALGASPADLGQAVVTLEDVWGRDAERIRDRLHDTPSWDNRFAIADAMLLRRFEAGPSVDPEVARAWELIVGSGGRVRVDQLARETGRSRTRLWSRFRDQIGLSPKRAAQLVRFDQAAHHLAAGVSAARVAAEGGYADQSHLHRDVQSFTGATPTAVAGAPWLAVDDVAWPEYRTFVQDLGARRS